MNKSFYGRHVRPMVRSDWTPWRLCPSEEIYHVLEPSGGIELEALEFLKALVLVCKPETILELGSGTGAGTAALASGVKENECGHVYSIDINPESVRSTVSFLANAGLGDYATVLHADSKDMGWTFGLIDLLFVDSGFERADDIKRFYRYLSSRAIIVCHDGADPQYGFATCAEFERVLLPTPTGLLVMQAKRLGIGLL